MYGLTRIALHNSYFTGLSVMFEIDGHSNASGGNGAGKTSALNLIPVFYGTDPNQLVDQVADKDSFLDFYLPKQSSALIYEHKREDGYRLVVMYRNSKGTQTLYRFVHGTLEDTFFNPAVAPLTEKGVPITDVFHALADMGVQHSKQINLITDYRAIIQNDNRLLRRKGRNSSSDTALAREYCLGGPNEHMSHLDRMSYAILRRADMFDRLKKMIAETQFSDLHIDDRPEHLKDKMLIEDIAGLRIFDSAESRIRECIDSHQQRKLVIRDRDQTASQLKGRCIEAMVQAEALGVKCKETDAQLRVLKNTYTEESTALRDISEGLKSELDQLNKDIEAIYTKYQSWQDWNIAEKQSLYSNLEHHISRFKQLKSDHRMLTEKVSNLEQARQSAESKAKEQRDKGIQRCSSKQLELAEEKSVVVGDYSDRKTQLAGREKNELEKLATGEIAQERSEVKDSLVQAKQSARNRQISEEDQREIDTIDQKTDDLTDQLQLAQEKHQTCETSLNQHKQKHQSALGAHQQTLEHHNSLQRSYDELRDLVFPTDNSLLAELRTLNPLWAETVGKVINPSLLIRSDLQPTFNADDAGALYGWSIALDKLDTPEHAVNEEALKARLEEAETRLRIATKACEDQADVVAELFKGIKPLELALTQAAHELSHLDESAKALRIRYQDTKRRAQENAKQRQVEFERQATSLEIDLKKLDERIRQRKEEITESFRAESLEVEASEQTAIHDIDTKISLLRGEVDQVKSDFKDRVQKINLRFSEQCERQGVDPVAIRDAKAALDEQSDKVVLIQDYLPKLQEYDQWKLAYWDHVPDHEKRLSETQSRSSDAEDDIRRHNRKHMAEKSGLEKDLSENRATLTLLNTDIEQANTLLSRCPVIEDTELSTSALVDLAEALNRLLADEDRLRVEVLKGVGKAQTIISEYNNSRISKAWETLLEQRKRLSHADVFEDSFRLQQPDDLSHLLDQDIPAIRDILIQQVRAVGDSLSKYHDCLKGLNDEVSRVSRHLGKTVNTNQRIENLTNIELQVTSVVVEGDYWDKLSTFNQQWKEWQEGRDITLPPEPLLHAIQSANDALQSARIGNDINSLIRLKISLDENGRRAHVSNAREFDALSSNGLSYLAILVIFIGMARYLCTNKQIALHWPIDELAALSPENISRLFQMLDEAGLYCFSAFPSTDPNLLKFFKHRKLIDRKRGIRNLSERVEVQQHSLKDKLNLLAEATEV